jgi:hypothetical protein
MLMEKPEQILPQLLQDLDKEALIGIIIRQGNELEQRWQQNEALRQERDSLLKRIEELERVSKRPVAPFRIEEEKRKKEKKQAGSPKGHPGYYRKVSGPLDEPGLLTSRGTVSFTRCKLKFSGAVAVL